MRLSVQNRQLIKVAGSLNLLFFLLCIIFFFYPDRDASGDRSLINKILLFTLGSGLCWIINLFLFLFIYPLAPKWKYSRWLFYYLPSYLITFSLGIIIARFVASHLLSGEVMEAPIAGPINVVFGVNTLSLVAIELILARYAQATMHMEVAQLRSKSIEAQHEKLKNQLHPHFLFNSLTALNSLIRKDPVLAESYLVKLASFLRFSMSHNEQNVVALEEELKFSIYYLEMQKTRFGNALSYKVHVPIENLADALLPVFSLQLTLENAIKHNLLTRDRPLQINMQYLDSDWLMVENNIQVKPQTDPSSGLGLKNLSDRYKLLTQEDIVVESNHEFFRVYLKLIRP